MSLNKTLDRFFDEIRREAKRNPEFADRLDAVLRGHVSRREIDDLPPLAGEVASDREPEGGIAPSPLRQSAARPDSSPARGGANLNPVGLYQSEGEEALAAALATLERAALLALVAEHNLDPAGEANALDRDALAEHVVAQAKRRAKRDEKLFDY